MNTHLKSISEETSVNGSAITVARFIDLIQLHLKNEFTHSELRQIFSINREIQNGDFTKYSYTESAFPNVAIPTPTYGELE